MAIPVRTALRRSCREASGVAILSRLPAKQDGGQTLRQRRLLAGIKAGRRYQPPRPSLLQWLGGWLARHFSRIGSNRTV
ncbi:hypothetical protein [Chromobacterium violaceum]|uniref:Uncharacterized protein n=1 Tax=Chromobacterium violaceum TaxID=536 RepID=A0A1R0MIE2_CHRVL|nr:hypothetical protein [Chromobacterium violaceum]ATP27239.1 hypothetical protein CRN81_01765 [Chromobacterium violaceum]ATP31152.1 hypothetical protein CR207_01765 [Chromobacterium violaceum]KJH66171.1 hypothetical protein UF16_17720 [Chromobacterium violaceum]KMN49425.1 hypothetical protein VK93_10720 [Chromobacterium violaceum]KMN84161.1 hypothetical protein VL02_21100 [Chromobacterium violaceum]